VDVADNIDADISAPSIYDAVILDLVTAAPGLDVLRSWHATRTPVSFSPPAAPGEGQGFRAAPTTIWPSRSVRTARAAGRSSGARTQPGSR
jgi:hypothetical protein